MKKDQIKNSIEQIKRITLTPKEKSDLFVKLNSYIGKNPELIIPNSIRSPYIVKSPYSIFIRSYVRMGKPLTISVAGLLIVLLAGGSTVFASQSSLPGDLLYPVKIHISEPLRVALAVSNDAKQKVQVDQVDERLKEAETLAVQGRLSTSTTVEVQNLFDNQVNTIKGKLSTKNEDSLDVALSAHSIILRTISKHSSVDQKANVGDIISVVDKHLNNNDGAVIVSGSETDKSNKYKSSQNSINQNKTNQDKSSQEFSAKKIKIQQVIDSVNQKINQNDSKANSFEKDILDSASTSIQSARDSLNKAQDNFTNDNSVEANVLINSSEKSVNEASVSIDQGLELGKIKNQNEVNISVESGNDSSSSMINSIIFNKKSRANGSPGNE